MKKDMTFDDIVRNKALLWCDRHCCLCKKACGINIEVHHILPKSKGGDGNIENAIPLCYDCHAQVGQYNEKHPKGNKYRGEELRLRRDQIYEEFTRHLVPPIHYEITQDLPMGKRVLPDVGFNLTHLGDYLPVRARVQIDLVEKNGSLKKLSPGLYAGEELWNLNPHFQIRGHFPLPKGYYEDGLIKLRVAISLIDQYERGHEYLPVEFIYIKKSNSWYFEP